MSEYEKEIERADSAIELEDYRSAVSILTAILQGEPDYFEALWRIGLCWTEIDQPEKAVKALDYAVSIDRTNSRAFEACGCAYFKLGNLTAARVYLEKARDMNPESSSVERNLGVIYNQLGAFDKSYTALKRSYKLNPLDYRTMYAIASAHVYFGNYEKAGEVSTKLLHMDIPEDFKALARQIQHIINGKSNKQN